MSDNPFFKLAQRQLRRAEKEGDRETIDLVLDDAERYVDNVIESIPGSATEDAILRHRERHGR